MGMHERRGLTFAIAAAHPEVVHGGASSVRRTRHKSTQHRIPAFLGERGRPIGLAQQVQVFEHDRRAIRN
jgi:hypothetical protein